MVDSGFLFFGYRNPTLPKLGPKARNLKRCGLMMNGQSGTRPSTEMGSTWATHYLDFIIEKARATTKQSKFIETQHFITIVSHLQT